MSDNLISIQVKDLGKCYRIYNKPQDRLKQLISFNKKTLYREFWALENVSFQVKKGESIGIIGRNGSGKSTLLQMLCKTLTPTTGDIWINGRIAALLELGAGFNFEFTGRENIYLNGAILGFTQKEMDLHFDAILEFAEIGEFINQPVKTYSSGMFVRLAFAIQACVKPDILIVDEALSVGDIFFQQKCAKRMQELREQGTTLIFVSHDMALVRDLCEKALYLKAGKLIFWGASKEAIRKYYLESNSIYEEVKQSLPLPQVTVSKPNAVKITEFVNNACWSLAVTEEKSNKKATIIAVSVEDKYQTPSMKASMTDTLHFRVLYQNFSADPICVAIALRNRYNHLINCSGFNLKEKLEPSPLNGEYAIFDFQVKCMIEAGLYTFSIFLSQPLDDSNRGIVIDETPWLGPINICWDYENDKAPWHGMFGLPIKISNYILN